MGSADMVQLQTPKFAFYRGAVRPWGGAVIHVGSEGTYRGINVFEGLKRLLADRRFDGRGSVLVTTSA